VQPADGVQLKCCGSNRLCDFEAFAKGWSEVRLCCDHCEEVDRFCVTAGGIGEMEHEGITVQSSSIGVFFFQDTPAPESVEAGVWGRRLAKKVAKCTNSVNHGFWWLGGAPSESVWLVFDVDSLRTT
jgi:hypothetical protein